MWSRMPAEQLIAAHFKESHQLAIGERMLAQLMLTIANEDPKALVEVRGRNLATAEPRVVVVTVRELRTAIGK
jgi:actin-like ATPase involved in cell morphogenesis